MLKNILVTGSTRGIGRALAIRLAQENRVVFAVGRNFDLLSSLSQEASNIITICADITLEADRNKLIHAIKEYNEPLSIVHNAGVGIPVNFHLIDESIWMQHIKTNFFAPLLITRQLLPWLVEQRVLHITSGAACLPIPGLSAYCATKAAMQQAILCLNKELLSKNVYFSNLRPGLVATDLIDCFSQADSDVLPNKDFYVRLIEENKLIPPPLAAEFIAWVLLKTDKQRFIQTSWDIYEKDYQSSWLPANKEIPTYFL